MQQHSPSQHNTGLKPYYKSIIVIPVGPNEPLDGVLDTIASIRHYFCASHKVVIVDNSRKGSGEKLRQSAPDIDVVPGRYLGKFGSLYLNISLGTAHAYEHYRFDVLLRMDADALIIGPAPADDAIAFFAAHPNAGQIGVYKYDYQGAPMRWWPINVSVLVQGLLNPLSWLAPAWPGWHLRRMLLPALRAGYGFGEHVYGGGFFLSYACVEKLYRSGILTNPRLSGVRLQEDHITSLGVKAVGMGLGDFASGNGPAAQTWIGLPAAPAELVAKGKKVVHSVRSWRDMNEAQVRAWFRERRVAAQLSAVAAVGILADVVSAV